jgi:hypothetical protein
MGKSRFAGWIRVRNNGGRTSEVRTSTIPLRVMHSISHRDPNKRRFRMPEETNDRRIISSINALAFQPLVTLYEDGNVYDLTWKILICSRNLSRIRRHSSNSSEIAGTESTCRDLFINSNCITNSLLLSHSSGPRLHGKGTAQIVEGLFRLKDIMIQ